MNESSVGRVFYILCAALLAGGVYWSGVFPARMPEVRLERPRAGELVFVGDVMLSRHVETLMRREGMDYPFRDSAAKLGDYEHVIGNLEGPVPAHHEPTPVHTLRFSIDAELLPSLRRAGFTLMTLANNHTHDFGEKGYETTRTALAKAHLEAAGHPLALGAEHSVVLSAGNAKIAIIPINAVGRVDAKKAAATVSALSDQSDFQFVTIHWGEEYQTKGNGAQRALARSLIDAGADAIIGHHPHVVQHVEVYKNAPIFYSLGNFIFDQYWNDSVQEGLVVGVGVRTGMLAFELLPTRSERSVPRFMEGEERAAFLDSLAESSDPKIAPDIRLGTLSFAVPLASSSPAAMITRYR